jgi:membrane protease YdiL (CAAX protease family)
MISDTHPPHPPQQTPLDGWSITQLALWSEGALLFLSLPWILAPQSTGSISPLAALAIGMMSTIPLLVAMSALSRLVEGLKPLKNSQFGEQLRDLQQNFIFPLSRALNDFQILAVALLSGIGEEVFFRGLLPWLLEDITPQAVSVICSSFLFALLHFVGNFRRFSRLISIYVIAGVYLSLLYIFSQSILVPITCHACFNFISLRLNRSRAEAESEGS